MIFWTFLIHLSSLKLSFVSISQFGRQASTGIIWFSACASTKFSQFFTFFNLAIWQPACPPYPWPHLPQFEHIHNLGLNWRRFVETHHFTKCDPTYFKPLRWSYTTTSPFTTSQPLPLKIWVAPNSVEQGKKIAWLWFQLQQIPIWCC